MQSGRSSNTARYMALIRAAHIDKDNGCIFSDHFAHALSGEDNKKPLNFFMSQSRIVRPLRYLVAARGRFGEERLAAAVARGVKQAVILGAGFDSFSLRNPLAKQGLHVFEVDHPDTQEHKRARIAKANAALPASMTFVPVNFEKDDLAEQLAQSGFKADEPAYFMWMGVVPYLNRAAIRATMQFIASTPDAELTFDYLETLDKNWETFFSRGKIKLISSYAAMVGEPFLSSFQPKEIEAELRELGFSEIEDLSAKDILTQLCRPQAANSLRGFPKFGPHFVHAKKNG